MIQEERVRQLNNLQVRSGDYVLYWMQASQRVEYNHALEYAIETANRLNKPLVVFFGITEFPEANETALKEGLTSTSMFLGLPHRFLIFP